MSRRNEKRREANARARTNFGVDGSIGSRQERRAIQERGKKVELLADVVRDLVPYSPEATLELLTDRPSGFAPFLIDRLVREVARLPDPGNARPTVPMVRELITRLGNAFDPAMADRIGGDLSEVLFSRLMAPQALAQRDFSTDLFRVMQVMLDPTDNPLLGASAWKALLGVELAHFVAAVSDLSGALELGPVAREAVLAGRPPELAAGIKGAVDLLAAEMSGLRAAAAGGRTPLASGDEIYSLGPLLSYPVYRRADGTLGAPSIEYLRLAASPPSLYIRLARLDGKSRARTKQVGERFQLYLRRWTEAAAAAGWEVCDLDQAPVDGKIADLAIWPTDRTFLLVVEGKSTLQKFEAQLGHDAERAEVAELYQDSFNQIDATVDRMRGGGFPTDAPQDVPTFGLTVTLEHHWTTMMGGRVFPGVAMPYRKPTGPSAAGRTECRVISVDAYEPLANMLAWADAADVLGVLGFLFAAEDTRELAPHVRAQLGSRLPKDIPVNPLVPEGYRILADSFNDSELTAGLRAIADSLRN
ncbi:MAG: hypothetical protein Q8K58_09100 [Acidimicrobiales bacterium]|nr:hypothetical protein [Acidimicrobiales bacterium]